MNKLITSVLCIILSVIHLTRCSLRSRHHKYFSNESTFAQIHARLEALAQLNPEYFNELIKQEIRPLQNDEIHVLIDCLPLERTSHFLLKVMRALYRHQGDTVNYYMPIALHLIRRGYNLFEDIQIMQIFESFNDDRVLKKLLKADFKRLFSDASVKLIRQNNAIAFDDFALNHLLFYARTAQLQEKIREMFSFARQHYGIL